MAVTTFAKIQHRRGAKVDLPTQLHEGELGFCVDTRELFIGNSSVYGGNTQILTDSSNLISVAQYQFLSDTSVVSQTGASANQPTVRSLQRQLDDAWVNVKAYGAQGNGISDDTVAIQRAITDLYTKTLPLTESVSQARKTIWFPTGTYVISAPLLLYPECVLQGENATHTVISLQADTPQLSVIRLCDSLGQTGANQGTNGASLCENVCVNDITLHAQDTLCVALLERPNQITFEHCVFSGTWAVGDPIVLGSESVGLQIEKLGSFTYGNVNLNNCVFRNLVYGMNVSDSVQNIHFDTCYFEQMDIAVLCTGTPGPQYVQVHNSTFDQISNQAINVQSTTFVNSLNNVFLNVNTGSESIYWAASTSLCSSMSDQFVNTPGVLNLGTNNLIFNAQQNNITLINTIIRNTRSTSSATVTLTDTDDVVLVDCSASAVAVSLDNTPLLGQTVTVKDASGTSFVNPITISSISTTVDGASTFVINTNYGSTTLIYSGSEWKVI